jgi:hypothetical protein
VTALSPRVRELRATVHEGPFADIFLALQARHVFQVIGEHAQRVETSTFQPAFSTYQSYASDSFILAVTRLLERPSGRYRLQSMPAVLEFLRKHAGQIPVREPIFLEQSMQRLGVWSQVASLSGTTLTTAVVDVLLGRTPNPDENEALNALKTLRDKRIAHPERVVVESLPTTTWNKADALQRVPIEALATCGAYLSEAFVDAQGDLFEGSNAKRAGFATSRALRELRIAPQSDTAPPGA